MSAYNKTGRGFRPVFRFTMLGSLVFVLGIAIAAIHRATVARLERHLSIYTTSCADCLKHLPLTTMLTPTHLLLFGSTTGRTALGIIGETLLCVEFLLSCRECEINATIYA